GPATAPHRRPHHIDDHPGGGAPTRARAWGMSRNLLLTILRGSGCRLLVAQVFPRVRMSPFGIPGGVDRLPSRSFRMTRSFERGSMREVKVSLFLPQLLWVAIRRRAAMQGVSSLHLVRSALEAFEPDWREAELRSEEHTSELQSR